MQVFLFSALPLTLMPAVAVEGVVAAAVAVVASAGEEGASAAEVPMARCVNQAAPAVQQAGQAIMAAQPVGQAIMADHPAGPATMDVHQTERVVPERGAQAARITAR